jgi:peptidoglycan/LPS O-acetylase OafA/YrhL
MFESRLALVWGERSYSVYLIHYPLIFILMFLLTFAAMPRWCLLVATPISAFALTGMFWLVTYEFIERPGIRLGHFWANRVAGRRAVET